MAALNFPVSPTLNQVYSANGKTYVWNGTSWVNATAGYTGSTGSTGYTGSAGSWSRKTANYTAVLNERIIADTTAGQFTITLPGTPSIGDSVLIADGHDWATTPLIVGRNGSTIESIADDLLLDIKGATVEFVYDSTTWEVFPTIGVGANTTVTLTGTQTLTNKTLVNPRFENYTENVVAIGTVTTAYTFNLTTGTIQTATLTASTACTFTMPTATAGKSFTLLLKQAAVTGGGSATFTGVKWNNLGAPTITTTAGSMDILSFTADGTNWYGSFSQGFTP